jgi:hypothetical protein
MPHVLNASCMQMDDVNVSVECMCVCVPHVRKASWRAD